MDDIIYQNLRQNSPVIAWIHNISLNQQKYMKTKMAELDLGHDVRYVLCIYDNPDCCQKDLVEIFGQSKGNVAKALKKLEQEGLIERKVNPDNKREYIINTTEKGSEIVPKYRYYSKQWEKEVGIGDEDDEFIRKLIEVAVNGMELIK